MVIQVTRIGGDGSIRRAVVDTAGREDAARWERLAQQAALQVPPPYGPEPGQPACQISAGGHAAQVAEKDLAGPLRKLISALPRRGGPPLAPGLRAGQPGSSSFGERMLGPLLQLQAAGAGSRRLCSGLGQEVGKPGSGWAAPGYDTITASSRSCSAG